MRGECLQLETERKQYNSYPSAELIFGSEVQNTVLLLVLGFHLGFFPLMVRRSARDAKPFAFSQCRHFGIFILFNDAVVNSAYVGVEWWDV
jgi:hypothetical protein